MVNKVLKADASASDAYAKFDLGSDQPDIWITFKLAFDSAALTFWEAGNSAYFVDATDTTDSFDLQSLYIDTGGWNSVSASDTPTPPPVAATWQTCELHCASSGGQEFYLDGVLVFTGVTAGLDARFVYAGQFRFPIPDPAGIAYLDDFKVGTTRGGTDLFSDDFESGDLSAWSSTVGDVSVVDDPFPSELRGILWSPTAAALDVAPTWVRLDDPDGYRLVNGFSITRGRASEFDKTVTGTATITFRDTHGYLDPTNPSGPWYGQLDPMKQAMIQIQNPVTDTWETLFRGFIAGPDHELEMFTTERGFDVVTWQLVDAFDLFANVILTHGVHGDTPGLATFPNIYYKGTPSNLSGEADVFRHVDQRIAQLLDDAGWPGTGNTIDIPNLRNIFSGNVSVQGSVYARKDSLLSALFDAADAEFPGIANIFVSREGVVTFHGRFARFFPERPGYGINHWYAGSLTDASLDPTVAPLSGPLRFYRSKDDIINACYALPQGVDETDGGVVHASDATSQAEFGYRSENFESLIVSAGHDDLGNPTTAVEEANKFSDYIVSNYKDPKTRVGTLLFKSRGVDAVGATALWDLMTRVEIGDLITLTTEHAGGGGFGEDFYVENIRYSCSYIPGPDAPAAMTPNIQLELEVSPKTFFASNPFGTVDLGES